MKRDRKGLAKADKAATETKFNKDDIVYERVNPSRKLIVGDFRDGLYYCRLPENHRRQFVYQERELMAPAVAKSVPGLVL
jgi:hypothetical protein